MVRKYELDVLVLLMSIGKRILDSATGIKSGGLPLAGPVITPPAAAAPGGRMELNVTMPMGFAGIPESPLVYPPNFTRRLDVDTPFQSEVASAISLISASTESPGAKPDGFGELVR